MRFFSKTQSLETLTTPPIDLAVPDTLETATFALG
jgi:hypothetical protein